MSEKKEPYQFDTEFQQEILQFVATDLKSGIKAIPLFESDYFVLVEHSIIAEAFKRYYDKKFIVPSKAILKEELKAMLKTKRWQSLLLPGDKEKVNKVVNRIYAKPVRNAESVYELIKQYSQFVAFKNYLEDIDIQDFSKYPTHAPNIQKALTKGTSLTDSKGVFLIRDAKSRVTRRADSPPGFPTPFWQINRLLNNGGTSHGNVIVVMGEEKKFKTGFLLNVARGYLKKGKVILIADFENGEDALGTRADQSVVGTDRKSILSDKGTEEKLLKMLRRYGRFGGEVIIKRFPAGENTIAVGNYIKSVKDEFNLEVKIALIDYPDVMGDTKGHSDEVKRIGQVYLDLKNLGDEFELEAIYAPSHITREAAKETGKKRRSSDASKAQDKSRHADMTYSIEQSDEEREAGVMRLELVNQRDGPQDGRAYFFIDFEKQRLKECTKAQAEAFEALRRESSEAKDTPRTPRVSDEEREKNRKKNLKKVSDV